MYKRELDVALLAEGITGYGEKVGVGYRECRISHGHRE